MRDIEDDDDGFSITLPNGEKVNIKGEDGTSIVDAFVNRKGLKKYIDSVDEGHLVVETDEGEFIDTGKVTGKDGKDGKDGEDGKDYILTNRDKEEIAREIQVPIVEKVIERTEVIKEQPIITNEIKEVAMYEDGEQIVKKINELELDEDKKIDAKHIKNLPESTTIIRNVASGIGIKENGLNKTTDVKSINFTGATVSDNNGNVTVDITGGGGSGTVESVVAGTGIVVDNTDPANPIVSATGGDFERGSITGTLSDQTDLQTALDNKANTSSLGDLAYLDEVDTDEIFNHAVTNTKLAQMNSNTIKGRLSGNGTPQDIAMVNLPISTETQTALNAKQDTLVSGTNIKTVNGNSLLGSGDITTLGGGSFIPKNSVDVIQRYSLVAIVSDNLTVLAAINRRVYYMPFYISRKSTLTELGFQCTTAGGGYGIIGIYDSLNDLPNNILVETSQLPLTLGYQSEATSLSLTAGVLYRTAIVFKQVEGSGQIRSVPRNSVINFLGYNETSNIGYTFYYETLDSSFTNLPATASDLAVTSATSPFIYSVLS